MTEKYQPQKIEKKWQKIWEKEELNIFQYNPSKKKYYVLVELPYTSGDLHIGHWFAFTTPDVVARFKRMNGFNVFFPIGFDAFGLPAENAAIKRGIHPKDWTMRNIQAMTQQFSQMGSMINNWDKVVITCSPQYYRWNQWIFIQMFKKGLIYQGKALSNWCPSCQTVLANENVVDGRCWRCDSQVEQKEVPQWFIKITAYADRLLWPENPKVDWPTSVREGQNNWIGRSQGTEIKFKIPAISAGRQNSQQYIKVFTTRADTLFGVTAIVLAPEHWLVKEILNFKTPAIKIKQISEYVNRAKKKQEEERIRETREKTGVDTGLKAIHPLTGEELPIWIADYVLGWYGEGAVMLVPGHDKRDYEFAVKYKIPIKVVILPEKNSKFNPPVGRSKLQFKFQNNWKDGAFTDYGILVNSGEFSGLTSKEAIGKITQKLQSLNLGKKKIVYHLRDWSISRQRYWGTPIPIVYCRNCYKKIKNQKSKIKNLREGVDYVEIGKEKYAVILLPEDKLPIELPYEVDFTPKGKPPLASNEKWLKTKCPICRSDAIRDPQTMDTFFDSSWYWYRYVSPVYNKGPFDKEMVAKLTPVDIYFGGAEHTLGHTLYARFFTKFFYDLGLINYEEFALKRVQHGIVLGPDGNKMSKSKGNVINPDEQVAEYGADTVRLYLCFMMPYEGTGPWSHTAIAGVYRFLKKVWDLYQYQISNLLPTGRHGKSQNENLKLKIKEDKELVIKLNKTIRKVTEDIKRIKLNTAVAAMMEFVNEWEEKIQKSKFKMQNDNQKLKKNKIQNVILSMGNAKKFLQILAPFAPFITEEIWREVFGEKTSIHLSQWPKAEELENEEVIIPVQVNGKLRGTIKAQISNLKSQKYIEQEALKNEKVKKYLEGKRYRMIYVEGKVVNFVTL